MKRLIKSVFEWLGFYQSLRSMVASSKLKKGSTVLIHIGKSGGRTIRDGIVNANMNLVDAEVHIDKPVYRKDLKYIVVARGPIARLDSAFRWRYKIVVKDANQRGRFKGEYEVLLKYKSLNVLAEALYDEFGQPNHSAQADIRKIHHIREDISFYLSGLLRRCQPNQIVAVLMQENLDEDISRVFGYRNELNVHRNPASEEGLNLSDRAIKNLRRFFLKDFEALNTLYCWGLIDREIMKKCL